ncbi:MAG: fibronectin type III domain-containing protein, partial [Armatimonadota bacterium]
MVGQSFVVQAVLRNADPANLDWTLTPPNVGRLIVDGTRATYIAPERVPSPPDVFVGASLRGTSLHSECRITITTQPMFPPKITNFEPKQGVVGINVRIEGENFGATPGENDVRFGGGAQAVVLAVDPSRTRMWVVVPPNAKTGKITVTTSGGTAESVDEFKVIGVSGEPSFQIKYFEPAHGAPGSHVKIETTGLGPMGQRVLFNGVEADIPGSKLPFAATDTVIYRRVPQGAISGPITIIDSYKGVASSAEPFTVLPPPTVYKMETDPPTYPKKTKAGKPLYIYGSNFLPSVSSLPGYVPGGVTKVRFNGMNEDVDVAYADQNKLMVIVPQGASTGPVKVITYFNNPLTYKWLDPITGQPYGPDLVGEAETPDSLIIDEPPTIAGFTPKEGYEGDLVTISGTNFDPRDPYSNEVRFNGITAPVVEVAPDGRSIKAVVPFNATTGKISVKNGAGEAVSAEDFKVLHKVLVTPSEAAARAGGSRVSFSARVTGIENQSVNWSASPPGIGSIDNNGVYTPPELLVSPVTLTITAESAVLPSVKGTAKLTVLPPLTISIDPKEGTLNAGGAPLKLTARPSELLKLVWSITPQNGDLLGTEDTVRFYSPPAALPVESVAVVVRVSFADDPKVYAEAKITVRDPLKFVQEPTHGQVTSNSAVIVWETNKPTRGGYRIEKDVQPKGDFVFPAAAQPSTKHSITVTGLQPDTIYWYDVISTAPDHADLRSGPKFFRTKADYRVAVEPAKVTITTSAAQTFTATVTGGAVTRVTWSMEPSIGSLITDKDDPNKAVYIPPSTKPQETVEIKIRATSVGDPSRYAEAVVVLVAVGIKIDPIGLTMVPGDRKPFTAVLTGVQGVVVNWEITPKVQGDPIPDWSRDKDNPNKIWVTAPNLPPEAPPGDGPLVVYRLRAWADVGGSIIQAEAVFNVRRPHKVIIENPPDKIARVRLGEQFSFHAKVINYISSPTVEWEVDPPIAYGSIHKNTGLYTAPTEMPSPPEAIVRARSAENPNAFDEAKVILLPVPGVKLEPTSATVRGGKSVLFTATVTEAEPDLNWYVNGVPGGNEANGIIRFPNPASTLKAEYVAPNVQSDFTATIKAELTTDPGRSYTVTVKVKPALGVKVNPPDAVVRTGDKAWFTAEPVNAEIPEISWEVIGGSANGVVKPREGNPKTADYTAPLSTPDARVRIRVAVKDRSDGETAYGFALITVQPRPVLLDPPGPIEIPAGQSFTFRLLDAQTKQPVELNAEFPPDAGRIEPLDGGYYRFTAAERPPVPAQFVIRASRKEDPKAYADLTVTIVENIVVTVSADREHVYEGEQVQFRADVSGTEDKQVAWKVSQGPGSIDDKGLYTAGSVGGNQPVTVTVTAVGKNQAVGQKSITVWPKIPVVVQPPQVELYPGDTQRFAVSGGIQVVWSLRGAEGVGSIDKDGLYTAPLDVSDTLEVPVVATYTTPAGSLFGSALVRVLPPIRVVVKPEADQVLAGGSIGFTAEATVAGRPLSPSDEPLTWEVLGGDVNGTVKWVPGNSHSAVYTAPAGVDAPRTVEVRARSTTANGRFFGSAVVQVVPKPKLIISDLTVVLPGAVEAALSWVTNAPAVFRIEYGASRDGLDQVVQSDRPQTEHKVVLVGLKPDTEYWFRITVFAQDYEPAVVGPQSFRTTGVPVIVAVDGPRYNIVDPTSVEIIWSTNVESSSLVEYGLTQEYGLRESSDKLEKEHRILLKDLTPGSEYHYRVTSRREGWKEYVSADLTFSLPARPIPPKDLQVASEVYTATVTWTTDAPAVGTVFYGTDPGRLDAVAVGPSEPSTKHSIRLENLSPATVYYYKVVCEAPGYTKTESQVQSFATFDVDQVLILELGHTLVPPSSAAPTWSAEITWRTNVDSTSVVEYGTDPGALAAVSQSDLVKAHKVVLENLVPGAVYTYRVRSEAPGMKAGVSPLRTFAVLILKDAVHILTPPRAENVKASEAEIVWTTDVESDSLVEYGIGGELTEKVLDENLATLHRVKLTNLKSSTAYSFRVRSGRSGYEPAQSDVGRFTTRAVVTIDTEPRIVAGSLLIDSDVRLGAELPLRFEWSIGDAHDVSAPMVVDSGPGRRLRFSKWQDGTASRERTVSVAGDLALKALYTTQYLLSVQVRPADADVVLEGEGWYEAGAEATAAAPEVTRIAGVLYRLSGWELDGEKKPAGVLKVTMDGPHTAVAVYERADTAGPDVVELTAAPNPTAGAKSVTIRAVISDIGRGGTAVAGAEYYIDTEAPAGSGVPMEAESPPFDSPREAAVASISTAGWKVGSYKRVYVRGRDALGNWGQAAFVDIAVTAETVAPGTVSDLRASGRGQDRILLNWTAPGGDGNVGQAARYDIRISTAPITAANFGAAQQVTNAPLPAPAGAPESLLVTGLQPDTLYYFALKAVDEAGNWSQMSNVASARTAGPPPVVVSVTPPDASQKVPLDAVISVTFSKPMDAT